MKKIFLAPRSNESSYDNFESTTLGGRSYTFLEPHLNENEKEVLSRFENISVWGNTDSLKSRWQKIEPGDYVLFYAKGIFYLSSTVILTKYSPSLGEKLWPKSKDGKSWPCLFFVDNLKEVNIPIKVVQELAEYDPSWDRVQGFMMLRESGIDAIVEKFGNVESFIEQDPKVHQAIQNILEKQKEESLEDEVSTSVNKEDLFKIADDFTDDRESHALVSSVRKVRIENREQKKESLL